MNTRALNRRLAELEKGLISDPTLLTMPDGRVVTITGSGDYLLRLMGAACGGGNLSSEQAAQLELIRQCRRSEEPGGAHIVELIRAYLLGPVEDHVDVSKET